MKADSKPPIFWLCRVQKSNAPNAPQRNYGVLLGQRIFVRGVVHFQSSKNTG